MIFDEAMTYDEYKSFYLWMANQRNYAFARFDNMSEDEIREIWNQCRAKYRARRKATLIHNAYDAVKSAGFKVWVPNHTNGCLVAISNRGQKMTYYAGTGTITGYGMTNIQGVDDFIRLLKYGYIDPDRLVDD